MNPAKKLNSLGDFSFWKRNLNIVQEHYRSTAALRSTRPLNGVVDQFLGIFRLEHYFGRS